MSAYDMSGYGDEILGWQAEIGARIHDFLIRKAVPATEKLGALVQRIESAVSRASLKAALRDLLLHLRRETPAEDPQAEATRQLLLRVLEHRRRESIENYSAYLFVVDVLV